MSQSEFGPGRLDASWLGGFPEDPWVLETCDPDAEGHRDAFLGNGWIGQRISVEGDAGLYSLDRPHDPMTPGGCLIHGLWDATGLMPPPLWAVLEYHDGECLFRRGAGTWTNYRQQLDLRIAVLTTDLDWDSGSRRTRITTRVFLSRSRQNVGVVEREITPAFDGTIRFIDRLDGGFIQDARDWRVGGAG